MNSSPMSPFTNLGRHLGSGSFSEVYLATFVGPIDGVRREIAVKRAPLEDSSSLIRERRVLKAFSDCPEIIDCYSDHTTTEEGGAFYNLLLEYAPAGTLDDLIKNSGRHELPDSDVRVYTRMILQGLKSMHDRSYVHCDLKPENILLFPAAATNTGGYRLKLADFGQAKEPGEVILPEIWQGEFRGTPCFMSPESVELGEIGPELDVWSLGCTVVMMAGNGMDKEGKDFMMNCLQKDPKNRPSVRSLLTHPYVCNARKM